MYVLAELKSIYNFSRYTREVLKIEEQDLAEGLKYDAINGLLKSTPAVRELSAHWIRSAYEHFQLPSQKDIIRNGFAKAGIIDAYIKGPVPEDPYIDLP